MSESYLRAGGRQTENIPETISRLHRVRARQIAISVRHEHFADMLASRLGQDTLSQKGEVEFEQDMYRHEGKASHAFRKARSIEKQIQDLYKEQT